MKNKKSKFIIFICLLIVLIPSVITLLSKYNFGLGKSVDFYLSSGFRMPHDAVILTKKEVYPLAYSNEGETYWIFKVDAQTAKEYLSHSPWTKAQWRKGPVTAIISDASGNLSDEDYKMMQSSAVWYLAEGLASDGSFYDGRIIIVDPQQNLVYFREWNH